MAAVDFVRLHKQYGSLAVLKGVHFSIQDGDFFGLLGPNGAGKSTLINAMAGLVRATSGSVRVFGKDVVRDYRQTRRLIGLVPQELVSDAFFSVRSLLRLQAGYFSQGRESYGWIEELLDILALKDKANDLTSELSGGMKRRLLIAIALVHKPKIIVLDEPTAGVDVDLRKTLWGFIRTLHTRGHTIILTTHYLEEAEQLCDRIAIIDEGRLVTIQNKQDLIRSGNKLEQAYLDIVRRHQQGHGHEL